MQRTLHAFQIHAHQGSKALDDYRALFEAISQVTEKRREMQVEDKVVALKSINIYRDYVTLVAYEGEVGVKPLFYDREARSERVGEKGKSELLATRTHAVIDLNTRYVTVEFNQKGAKAKHILGILSAIANRIQGYSSLLITMPPVAGLGFLDELNKFNRIRLAKVQMVMPNNDWHDAESKLTEVADASEARMVDVVFTAHKQSSLSKAHGVVQAIKGFVARRKAMLKNVVIHGTRFESKKEVQLKLLDHTEQRKVEVEKNPIDGYPDGNAVLQQLIGFAVELGKRPEQADGDEDDV